MSLFEPFIVAAIDIGTTYSTYAFSTRDDFKSDPLNKIYGKTNWKSSCNFVGEKTATAVLFDEQKNFRYFGFKAEDVYANLDDDQMEKWYFFNRFKMNLYQRKSYRENIQLKDIRGKKMPAIDVFSAAIAYLKDDLFRMVRNRLPEIKDSDFLWVITVPAIWEDGARQFMRKSAIKAHFWEDFKINNADSGKRLNHDTFTQNDKKQEAINKQIWLALEPETAALYCKFCQLQLIRSNAGVASTVPFSPKQKFLLMDLGGGTADIIAYEVMESHDLRELTEPNGGDWGGVTVDDAFWSLLRKICGDEAIVKFSTKDIGAFLEMEKQFELKKREISIESTELTRISLCPTLAESYIERRGVKPERDTIPSKDGIGYKKGKLELSHTVTLSLFEKPKKNIVDFVKHKYFLGGNMYDLNAIVMVGGFSASDVMTGAVKSAVTGMDIKVIIPNDPILAVVKGAVLYGHNHMAIRERVLPYTYGISLRVPFDETIHPIDKKIFCSNRQTYVVEDVFQPFMRAGTRVIPGETFAKHTYRALYYSTNKATIEIYRTRNPKPGFVTDHGCSRVGKLELEIPNLKEVGSTLVDITMSFGNTELTVEAKDHDSDNRIKSEFNFLI